MRQALSRDPSSDKAAWDHHPQVQEMLLGRGSAHVSSSYRALSLNATCGLRRRRGTRKSWRLRPWCNRRRWPEWNVLTTIPSAPGLARLHFRRVSSRATAALSRANGRHESVVRSVDRSAAGCARLGSVFVWRLAGAVSTKVRRAPTLSTHKRPRKRSSPVSPMSRSECAGRGARCREACACDSSTALAGGQELAISLLLGVGCVWTMPLMPL